MNNYFIGIMTGTSADSLDGCIVSFDKKFEFIDSLSIDFDSTYKKNYEECINKGYKKTEESKELSNLEEILNEKTIQLINDLLKKSKIDIADISSISLSGQTVFHTNEMSYQIGNPDCIADEFKVNVFSNFRNFDIKNGGLGAPLIPAFHKYLYSEINKEKIIFNIGGIANGTYLKGNEIYLASDVGPGNCLIDKVANKELGLPFDKGGNFARKGNLIHTLLESLEVASNNINFGYPRADEKTSYYKLLDYGAFLEISPNDALRCLTELTAEKIKNFFDYCNQPEEVIFHGGGAKNSFLLELLCEKLNREIKTTDNEIPLKFVEAAGFAYLAYLEKGEIYNTK